MENNKIDIWGEIAKIYRNHPTERVRYHAWLLLSQMNTAGGMDILRNEVEIFIFNYNGLKKK